MSSTEPFLIKLRQALAAGSFVKLTLSQPLPSNSEGALKNLYVRKVELRDGCQFSFLFRYPTRDITKNYPELEAIEEIGRLLELTFKRAHLFTITGDWQWAGSGQLKAARPAFTVAPALEHDRRKPQPIHPAAPFLQALGITNPAGNPRPAMADKLRQIQRFVEMLGHLVEDAPLKTNRHLRILDMGCGKGALTFAACQFFQDRGVTVEAIGIELREELVTLTNKAVTDCKFSGLRFEKGRIGSFPQAPVDLLIALHACDTATDDAIHYGIRSGASLIVTAPCCHKEIRAQLAPPPLLEPIVKHGILAEREAETVTDALRALLLEIHGYKASVFEFVSNEHTAKNLMIAASKRAQPLDPEPSREKLRELTRFYGIGQQHLAGLLGETLETAGNYGRHGSYENPTPPTLPMPPISPP